MLQTAPTLTSSVYYIMLPCGKFAHVEEHVKIEVRYLGFLCRCNPAMHARTPAGFASIYRSILTKRSRAPFSPAGNNDMAWAKRYLFVSNSDNGQTAPLISIMLELALRGNQCILASGASVLPRVQSIQRFAGFPVQSEAAANFASLAQTYPVFLHSLGESPVLTYLDFIEQQPQRFHKHCCAPPGKVMGWTKLYTEFVPDSTDEYLRVVHLVRDAIESYDADMVIVDNFSPFAVDGVRLTKRPFIETAPGSAMGLANNVNLFRQPLSMSGGRSESGGLFVFWSNLVFVFNWVYFFFYHPWSIRRREFRKNVLRITSPGGLDDAIMPPSPGALKQQIATLTFNVAGLDIYPPSAYDKSVFFVGPCFRPNTLKSTGEASAANAVDEPPAVEADDEVTLWMNALHAEHKRVVCVNMGTIYYYMPDGYANLVKAFEMIHARNPNIAFLWKIPNHPKRIQDIPSEEEANLPSYIKRIAWIPSVEAVIRHPALSVMMHHGGGNSLNEALAYGIPQFCVSQWVDTHDIGLCIQHSGVGLWSQHSPEFHADEICEKLLELVEDKDRKFRDTALAWKLKTHQAGGTQFAADVIQSYVTQYKFPSGSSKAPVEGAL